MSLIEKLIKSLEESLLRHIDSKIQEQLKQNTLKYSQDKAEPNPLKNMQANIENLYVSLTSIEKKTKNKELSQKINKAIKNSKANYTLIKSFVNTTKLEIFIIGVFVSYLNLKPYINDTTSLKYETNLFRNISLACSRVFNNKTTINNSILILIKYCINKYAKDTTETKNAIKTIDEIIIKQSTDITATLETVIYNSITDSFNAINIDKTISAAHKKNISEITKTIFLTDSYTNIMPLNTSSVTSTITSILNKMNVITIDSNGYNAAQSCKTNVTNYKKNIDDLTSDTTLSNTINNTIPNITTEITNFNNNLTKNPPLESSTFDFQIGLNNIVFNTTNINTINDTIKKMKYVDNDTLARIAKITNSIQLTLNSATKVFKEVLNYASNITSINNLIDNINLEINNNPTEETIVYLQNGIVYYNAAKDKLMSAINNDDIIDQINDIAIAEENIIGTTNGFYQISSYFSNKARSIARAKYSNQIDIDNEFNVQNNALLYPYNITSGKISIINLIGEKVVNLNNMYTLSNQAFNAANLLNKLYVTTVIVNLKIMIENDKANYISNESKKPKKLQLTNKQIEDTCLEYDANKDIEITQKLLMLYIIIIDEKIKQIKFNL